MKEFNLTVSQHIEKLEDNPKYGNEEKYQNFPSSVDLLLFLIQDIKKEIKVIDNRLKANRVWLRDNQLARYNEQKYIYKKRLKALEFILEQQKEGTVLVNG